MKNKWNELIITTEYENWSKLESYLYSNDIYSFELIDPRMENIDNREGRWDFIEDDIFKDSYDGITVKIYSSDDNAADIKRIKTELGEKKLGNSKLNLIDDEDWKNNWKSFYETQEIGEKIVIKPTWEKYGNKDNRYIIELDPGMAFGTGGHETTRMCLIHLQKYLKKNDDVIDIGCGSGILSIAAKMLGANYVIGADLDENAVEISKANGEHNKVSVDFVVSNLFSEINVKGNVVIANIVAEIVALLIKDLKNYLIHGGIFICSGIIEEKSYIVEEALNDYGFEILEKMQDNEWISIVAREKDA